jgi:50S ribosomal protein L16 3-hydroxylase
MLNLNNISITSFLTNYWQKKPLVIRQALPGFNSPISPDELAGLALEEEIESRIVWETPNQSPQWHLKRGPFTEKDFSSLPNSHWTLLVQGVDRVIPEVYALLDHFNFLPQWRVDDVMISFATLFGGVGPHYDNYDVFLYQAKGQRLWSLTSQKCKPENYIPELELRIMREFAVEEEILLEEGDMLYLPPHIGHYGISQSDECMTYSFGYRSYQGQELWDSLGDY